jgi:OmpA-OmpF porin, OOP family
VKIGRTVAAVLGLAAAAAAAPAAAQDKISRFYFGGSVGVAQWGDSCDDLSGIPNCKDTDDAWRLFAAYRFNRNLALEVGYANLGRVTAGGAVGGVPATFESKVQGWDYSGILSFSIAGDLYGFGRLGAYTMRAETDATFAGAQATPGETNTGFTLGAGAGYDLGFLGIRLEWQRYVNVGGGSTGEDTIDVFSAGALLRF